MCHVLQCVAVCCSVLQCVAMCCSVLQCVAVCCSVLQCVALRCVAVCCSVLHCSVLQYVFKNLRPFCLRYSHRTSSGERSPSISVGVVVACMFDRFHGKGGGAGGGGQNPNIWLNYAGQVLMCFGFLKCASWNVPECLPRVKHMTADMYIHIYICVYI